MQLDGRFVMDRRVKKFHGGPVGSPPIQCRPWMEPRTDGGQNWAGHGATVSACQLEDLPEDIPIWRKNFAYGMWSQATKLDGRTISQGVGSGGGGGGGGGPGLARVNLSGVPRPTATPYPVSTPWIHPMVGPTSKSEQGTWTFGICNKADGVDILCLQTGQRLGGRFPHSSGAQS